MTSVVYSVAKVVPITPFLLGIQVLIKGLQLPRWGTPSGRESPAFTKTAAQATALRLVVLLVQYVLGVVLAKTAAQATALLLK